jgi:PAS domain-containing protein
MYRTNAVVLCHDTSPDPLFVYANEAAQALWGRTWAEFIGWPSRLTAPPAERHARASVLAEGGVVRGYEGVRVDRRGRLFRIHDAVVWPVMDEQGHVIGQAAMFDSWTLL